MSSSRKPTAATVGFGTGDKRRRGAAVVGCDHKPERQTRQEPPYLVELRQYAEAAKREGDYPGFCRLRKLYLLAQAAAYEAEVGR